jgi:hypothetical protein
MTDTITREEKLMEAIATGSPSNIKPITREEMFLAKAGGQDVETPEPITRREKLLQGIIGNGGGDSYYDTFWDYYQKNGNRKDYQSAFSEEGWTIENLIPKYDIKPTIATAMFMNNNINNLKNCFENAGISVDFSNTSALGSLFQGSKCEVIIPIDCSSATALGGIFRNSYNVKKIELYNVPPKVDVDTNMFTNCYALEELIITGVITRSYWNFSSATALSHDSLLNILNILEDKTEDTSGTTWKITLGSTNVGKLTEEELDIAYQKGWDVV